MSLSSALYAGMSGLNANQTTMNVVGNNIANVNTTGFKSSTVNFSSQAYVTDSAGSPVDGNYGGSNPEQLGLGSQVASVTQDFTQGQIQTTGVNTDLAVSGSGFFVVQNSTTGQEFTRDGSFTLNSANQLVTSNGSAVQGYSADPTGAVAKGKLTDITIPVGSETISQGDDVGQHRRQPGVGRERVERVVGPGQPEPDHGRRHGPDGRHAADVRPDDGDRDPGVHQRPDADPERPAGRQRPGGQDADRRPDDDRRRPGDVLQRQPGRRHVRGRGRGPPGRQRHAGVGPVADHR